MTAQEAILQHREAMNRGDLETVNAGISDRYLGVFCLGNAGTHEIYHAEEIRDDNASADHYYTPRGLFLMIHTAALKT